MTDWQATIFNHVVILARTGKATERELARFAPVAILARTLRELEAAGHVWKDRTQWMPGRRPVERAGELVMTAAPQSQGPARQPTLFD